MKIIVMALFFTFPLLSFAFEENRIMLRWTSFPDHMYVHEFYVKKGQGLYLIRKDAYEQSREDYFPHWSAFMINSDATDEIATALRQLIEAGKKKEADRSLKKTFCEGVQWSADIKYERYDEHFITRCDTVETYNKLQILVNAAVKGDGIQVQTNR